jgi:hypothetical protein
MMQIVQVCKESQTDVIAQWGGLKPWKKGIADKLKIEIKRLISRL